MKLRLWLPKARPTLPRAILTGVGSAVAVASLRLVLQPFIGEDLPLVTFFPALLIAAIWGGMTAALVCLGLGLGAYRALFPEYSATADLPGSLLVFAVLGGGVAWVGSALASSIRELRASQSRLVAVEADLRTLVAELAHRSRNGLTIIMAIISQSARKAGTARELAETVNARLGAMADAQDEVVNGGGDSAALRSLLERTLSPFDLGRFRFEPSPPVHVARETAAALALLTHELATNAVKHGALSAPAGTVAVGWSAAADTVHLLWRERGGPTPGQSSGAGFGTRLLETALASHGGRAKRRFETDGMVCEIDFPNVTSA